MRANRLFESNYIIYSVELVYKKVGFLYKIEATFKPNEIIQDLYNSFLKYSFFDEDLDIPKHFSDYFLMYEISGSKYLSNTEKYRHSNGSSNGDLSVNQMVFMDESLTFEDFKKLRNSTKYKLLEKFWFSPIGSLYFKIKDKIYELRNQDKFLED